MIRASASQRMWILTFVSSLFLSRYSLEDLAVEVMSTETFKTTLFRLITDTERCS